jgi:predicted dehydrogenase
MEVPDTMSVSMNQAEKILFTWNSMFGNAYYGETCDYLFGTKGTLMHDEADRVEYWPQGKNTPGANAKEGKAAEQTGYLDSTTPHMQNFLDCVRSRKEPVCPFEMGFRAAIACQMAIASYRRQRTVRWDPQTQDIL